SDVAVGLRRAAPGAVVLQAAVDVVGPAVVHRDVVELAPRHAIEVLPVRRGIIGHVIATVAADQDVPAVLGVDPHGVPIAAQPAVDAVGAERLAAVLAAVEVDSGGPDDVLVGRVHADDREVEGSLVVAVDADPGVAAVGALVDAAGLRAERPLRVLHVGALAG